MFQATFSQIVTITASPVVEDLASSGKWCLHLSNQGAIFPIPPPRICLPISAAGETSARPLVLEPWWLHPLQWISAAPRNPVCKWASTNTEAPKLEATDSWKCRDANKCWFEWGFWSPITRDHWMSHLHPKGLTPCAPKFLVSGFTVSPRRIASSEPCRLAQ